MCSPNFNPEKEIVYAFNSFRITSIFQIVPLKKGGGKDKKLFYLPELIVNSF